MRDELPSGYGIAEHCMPFTAAAACGLAIPSPFSWGLCAGTDLPAGARPFRSPVVGGRADPRWYYVLDDADLSFRGNRFRLAPDVVRRIGEVPVPGLSFFDRPDQQDLVKVHLPYSWRTPAGYATLFLSPVNRRRDDGLRVISGLVETSWYANPVNLVVEVPPPPAAVHVAAGEHLAHAVLVAASASKPAVELLDGRGGAARDQLQAISTWHKAHAQNRNAYKQLARSASMHSPLISGASASSPPGSRSVGGSRPT